MAQRDRAEESPPTKSVPIGDSFRETYPMSSVTSPESSDFVVGVLVMVTTFLLCVFPLMDTDFWWHLRTGQLIWERGGVPRTDWFLFTDADKPWIDLHWGFQLLITAVYQLGGVNLVILVKALTISAAVGIGWFAAGRNLPVWLRAAVWIPALICISGRGYERPEMLSQLFLAAWLWIACRAEAQPKWVWLLPVMQLIWVNCHALFVLGLIVGGCFAFDYSLRKLAPGRCGLQPVSSRLTPQTVFGSGALCGLAAIMNPYLLDGALFPLVLYRKFSIEQEFYSTRIGEFQRPVDFLLRHGLGNIYLNTQIQISLIGIATFVAVLVYCRRWSPFRLLVFAGFLNLGWEASRNVNIFSLVAATITVANLSDLWATWFFSESTDAWPSRKTAAAQPARRWTPPASLVSPRLMRSFNRLISGLFIVWMVFIITGGWGRFAGEKKLFGLGERSWWFAHEAVQFAGQPGFPDRAYLSHIGIAATYEFHHGPARKVFMDPRLEVASQQTFLRWERVLSQMATGDRSWEPLLKDEHGRLPVVILDSRTSRPAINGLMNTRGWRLVHADPAAAVFLSQADAETLKLPPVDPSPLAYPP